MKDKLLKILTSNFDIEEDNGRTFLHLPIHQFKDCSPRFVFELIYNKDKNIYKLSDVKQTVRDLKEEYLFTDDLYNKMCELAPKYRLKVDTGEISVTFKELSDIKYFASYMIQFIAIIQYLANENAKNLDIDYEDEEIEDWEDIIDNEDY